MVSFNCVAIRGFSETDQVLSGPEIREVIEQRRPLEELPSKVFGG